MNKKQIKRKLFENKGEVTFTWIFEEDGQKLFSASEYYSDGHGSNFSILNFSHMKERSLNFQMSITGKGGRTTTESCCLEKETLIKLISILQNQVDKMVPFEREDDVITRV
jgi:hypothetical protein